MTCVRIPLVRIAHAHAVQVQVVGHRDECDFFLVLEQPAHHAEELLDLAAERLVRHVIRARRAQQRGQQRFPGFEVQQDEKTVHGAGLYTGRKGGRDCAGAMCAGAPVLVSPVLDLRGDGSPPTVVPSEATIANVA